MHSFLSPLFLQSEPQGSPHLLPQVELPCLGKMIWSLIPRAEQPLNEFVSQNLSPICHEKPLEKDYSILYGDTMPLAPLENNVGVYVPSIFAQNCRRGGIKKELECCHLNNTLGHSIETY